MLPDEGPHVEKWERSVFHNLTMLNESQEHGSRTFFKLEKVCDRSKGLRSKL